MGKCLEVWKVSNNTRHYVLIYIKSLFSSHFCFHLCQVIRRLLLREVIEVKQGKAAEGVCVDIHPAIAICRRKAKSHVAANRRVLITPWVWAACRLAYWSLTSSVTMNLLSLIVRKAYKNPHVLKPKRLMRGINSLCH